MVALNGSGIVDPAPYTLVRNWSDEAASRQEGQGYDFHHPAVLRNIPPPTVTFSRPLRWWSLDRQKRLAAIMRLRDKWQAAILALGDRIVPGLRTVER